MYLLTIIPFLIIASSLFAQSTAYPNTQPQKPITVSLAETSYFVINGSTNINQFHCAYDQLSTKPMQVELQHFPDSVEIKNAGLVLQTKLFDCKNQIINNDFQELLQSEEYPHIEFEVLSFRTHYPNNALSAPSEGENLEFEVTASITIINIRQQYSFPVKIIAQSDNSLTLEGTIELNLPDHNITPPTKFLGLIAVKPVVTIDFFAKLKVIKP